MVGKILSALALLLCVWGCSNIAPTSQLPLKPLIVKSGLKFCEGTVPYKGSILVSNFGGDKLASLNKNGKGYVVKLNGDVVEDFIVPDGYLNAPKGMAIKDNYLLIADVARIVIYNLHDLTKTPQVVCFPNDAMYVNDIAVLGQWAYVSVTDLGKVYRLDLSNMENLISAKPQEWMDVVGANGLLFDGRKLYIASYPVSGTADSDNVIYCITDVNNPKLEKLITQKGQYDGLALHKGKLYFTNWDGGKVGYVNLKSKEIDYMTIDGVHPLGAADICILRDSLYIPILPMSEVISVGL